MTTELGGAIELWALVAVNFIGFALGATMTAVAYYTYRTRNRRRSLRLATVGFALLTVATVLEPAYQLTVERTLVLVATERVIWLQLFEAALYSLGFLTLFYAVLRRRPGRRRRTVTIDGVDDELFDDLK